MRTLTKPSKYANHPWDRAAAVPLTINDYSGKPWPIDPGVAFFVRALQALGANTKYSCEGHPTGFYVLFEAPYELAVELRTVGYFTVEVEGFERWSIRKMATEAFTPATEKSKANTLRLAAAAWVQHFGTRLSDLA